MEKILDYKVSVENKTVTFEILHQDSEVRKFFSTGKKRFGKFTIGDSAHIELRKDAVYLKGISTRKSDKLILSSASEAFSYAADVTEAIELMIAEIQKKIDERKKKAEAKKASKKKTTDTSNFEYSVTVDGKSVTLKILKQTEEFRSFFYSPKPVGDHFIETSDRPEIRVLSTSPLRLKIFTKGSSALVSDGKIYSSNSEALKIAAAITKIFDDAKTLYPEAFGIKPALVLKPFATELKPGIVYIDSKDGELYIQGTRSGRDRSGYSLSENKCASYGTDGVNWLEIGNLSETIKIFGSDLRKSVVLKKFREFNKGSVKQVWHK